MKCGFCQTELIASLIPMDTGYQVSCTCSCGAVWVYDIYSLSCMALVKEPEPVPDKSSTWSAWVTRSTTGEW